MKQVLPKICLMLFVITMASCEKNEPSGNADDFQMIPAKTTAKVGETVLIAVKNAPTGHVAEWAVTPSTGATIERKHVWNGGNSVTFTTTGTYTVGIKYKKVICDSAVASNPGMDTCLNSAKITSASSVQIVVNN